jgi:lysophospholipase L1-like esterase
MEVATVPERNSERAHGGASAAGSAAIPVPRDAEWLARHEAFVERARAGDIDVLFVGDSLTDWWADPEKGGPVWERHFTSWKAANFGISADRTQHLLWRIQNGEAEGYSPRLIVLLIGTNNTGWEKDLSAIRNSAEETLEGILRILDELLLRFPCASILHFAIFPRDEADSLSRRQIEAINLALAGRPRDPRVSLVDIGGAFLGLDGETLDHLMPDKLHLSTAGYELWASAILEWENSLLAA